MNVLKQGKDIGIITARGNSKRVKKKNIFLCAGKPLLYWTAKTALDSELDRVILSTDDEEIAEIGKQLGLEVPFLRPKNLAKDETPTLPVIQNVLNYLIDKNEKINSVTLLQPTSLLRRSIHINDVLNIFNSKECESVVSVTQIPDDFHPKKFYKIDNHGKVNNDYIFDKENLVVRNGPAILTNKPSAILDGKLYNDPILTYEMDRWHSIDINYHEDLLIAELLINHFEYK